MILDVRRDKVDLSARGRLNRSLIDDSTRTNLISEPEFPRQEICVGQIQGRRNEPRNINNSAATDEYAVGIDEKYPAI